MDDEIVENVINIMTTYNNTNKFECKMSQFKELRNLPIEEVRSILEECSSEPKQINKKAKIRKEIQDVKLAISDSVGIEEWNVITERYNILFRSNYIILKVDVQLKLIIFWLLTNQIDALRTTLILKM